MDELSDVKIRRRPNGSQARGEASGGIAHLPGTGQGTHCREPSLLEECQAPGAAALHARDLRLSDYWLPQGEGDHSHPREEVTRPHLVHGGEVSLYPARYQHYAYRNQPRKEGDT